MGRPSSYTEEIATEFLDRLADGETMAAICGEARMPDTRTIRRWMKANESFRLAYACAREEQAHTFAGYGFEIANGKAAITDPAAARVQLDAIKWAASKLAPKHYGDKLDMNLGGQNGDNPVRITYGWRKK